MIPTKSLISLYLKKYSYLLIPSTVAICFGYIKQNFFNNTFSNSKKCNQHLLSYFLPYTKPEPASYPQNKWKKIEDFGNARSPFDNHPFPTKQMQHKTVKWQSNVPVINGGGYSEGSKRVRQRPEYRQRRLIETGEGE